MVTGYTWFAWNSVGVHANAPVEALIVAPVAAGVPSVNDHVIVFAGTSVSTAVTVNVNVEPASAVRLPGLVTSGAELTSFTVTVIASESVAWHAALSVTRTVIGYIPGPCASVGLQLKAPVVGSIVAPVAAGEPSVSENVYGGVPPAAVAVKVNAVSSSAVLFPIVPRTGAGILLTAIVRASKSLMAGLPLSVTRTVTGKFPNVVGVQLNTPVVALIVAPGGAPASSEKASAFAGMSASVAVAVKVRGWPGPQLARFPIGARVGGEFTSFTVIVIAALSLNGGVALSVAVNVTG